MVVLFQISINFWMYFWFLYCWIESLLRKNQYSFTEKILMLVEWLQYYYFQPYEVILVYARTHICSKNLSIHIWGHISCHCCFSLSLSLYSFFNEYWCFKAARKVLTRSLTCNILLCRIVALSFKNLDVCVNKQN